MLTSFYELILICVLTAVGAVLLAVILKKTQGRKKLIASVFIVFVLILSMLSVILIEFPDSSSEEAQLSVIASGSSFPGVSLEISDAELSGISPYIGIKIINDSDSDCIYGEDFDIKRKDDKGEYISSSVNYMRDSLAFILEAHCEQERKYYIDAEIIPDSGDYRFELPFAVKDGTAENEEHLAFIEFRTVTAVSGSLEPEFSMERIIYDNGSFSAVTDVSELPDIRISPEMSLFIREDNTWREVGLFNEITLSKDNFDKRIWHSDVTDQISAVDFRADNKRAWQIYEKGGNNENSRLYVLLEQDDGALYFCSGEYGVSGLTEPNSDSSYFRWICSLTEKDETD